MASALEFILKLYDQLSPDMRRAAAIADSAGAKIQASMNTNAGASRTFSYSLQTLKDRIESINKTRLTTNVADTFRTATREAQRLERQIDRIENKNKSTGGGLGGLIGAAAIGLAGKSIIDTGIQQESVRKAINFTTNGQGAAATSKIASISGMYGTDEAAGLEGFKTLSAATKGLGWDLQKNIDLYKGVAAGAATFNLNQEQSKGAFLALGQMASKGTVSAEELRGQLGERIPGAFGIAARAIGVTEQKLGDMMQKGEIMSSDFLPKFGAQMQKEFGQSAIDASTGAAANMNRFNNTMLHVKTTFAETLLPPFIKFMNLLRSGLEWIGSNKDIVLPLVAGLSAIILVTQGWAAAQGIVNAVMALNPIILIIGLVVALGLWIYNLAKKYEGWGDSIKAVWEIIKSFVQMNVIVWKSFGEMIWYHVEYGWLKFKSFIEWVTIAIGNLGNAFSLLIKGDFSAAKDALFQEIITPSSKALDELQKKHLTAQQGYKTQMLGEVQSIVSNYQKIGLKKKSGVDATTANAAGSFVAGSGSGSGAGATGASDKADKINSGGQKSIVINIGKQVENFSVHTTNMKEGVDELGKMIREELVKVLYSLNGVATS